MGDKPAVEAGAIAGVEIDVLEFEVGRIPIGSIKPRGRKNKPTFKNMQQVLISPEKCELTDSKAPNGSGPPPTERQLE